MSEDQQKKKKAWSLEDDEDDDEEDEAEGIKEEVQVSILSCDRDLSSSYRLCIFSYYCVLSLFS